MTSEQNKSYIKKSRNVFISSALVGTLLLSGSFNTAPRVFANGIDITTIQNTVKFNDYQANQYWSQDMLWAIERGYIQGYMNAKHPTNKNNKTIGNWINPQGSLTESQMLAVIFRFAKSDELAKTVPEAANWWASAAYQLAAKYNIPTKGSVTNREASNNIMTRGNLSQALASLYFGKTVSLETAVQFMYDADISTGLPDTNGKYAKTYTSFGVSEPLKRAQIVSFIKRYDNFIKSGKKVAEAKPLQVVNGIKVQFGKHTYASRNQTEYDKVMSVIHNGMHDYKSIRFNNGGSLEQYYDRYFKGERSESFPRGSAEERGLSAVDSTLGDLINNGISPAIATDMYKASFAAIKIIENSKARTLVDGSPRSAYDHLFNKITDCDAYANTLSASLDAVGYVTAIVTKPGHAEVIVKAGKQWYLMKGMGYSHVDKAWLTKNEFRVTTEPNDGSSVY